MTAPPRYLHLNAHYESKHAEQRMHNHIFLKFFNLFFLIHQRLCQLILDRTKAADANEGAWSIKTQVKALKALRILARESGDTPLTCDESLRRLLKLADVTGTESLFKNPSTVTEDEINCKEKNYFLFVLSPLSLYSPSPSSPFFLPFLFTSLPSPSLLLLPPSLSSFSSLPPSLPPSHFTVVVEAVKCLCNLFLNNRHLTSKSTQTGLLPRLAERLGLAELPCELVYYDLRLLFLITACDTGQR